MRTGRLAPKGECQRCGLVYPLNKLRKEWTGLRVCPDDYDPRPAEMKAPRYKPEGLILPNAAPETEPVFGRIQWRPTVVANDDFTNLILLAEDFSL